MARRILTKEERTQSILDTFRGMENEFYMLKGLLCIDHGVDKAIEKKTGEKYNLCFPDCKALKGGFDSIMIAKRMDEINGRPQTPFKSEQHVRDFNDSHHCGGDDY